MKFDVVQLESTGIDVIDGDRGKNYPHQNELLNTGFCLFLSAKNVTKSGFSFSETQFISQRKDALLNNGRLCRGDIVITTRGTVGNVALYSPQVPYENIRINSGMLIIRCANNISNQYLYQVLRSEWFQKQIMAVQSGSAQPQLPKSHFLKMNIPLPPLSIQEKIASILQLIDDKITTNNSINDNLLEQMQALYKSWFVDYLPFGGVIPESWTRTNIYSLANIIYGAPFASKQFNTEGNGKPIIRIRDLKAQQFATYTTEVHPKGYLLRPGDIVVGMDGEFRPYIWGNDEAWLNQRVCVFENKRPNGKAFLYFTIKPLLYAIEQTQVATTVIHIGKKDYDAFEIMLPDAVTLDFFDSLTSPMIMQIVSNSFENTRLAAMRDALLPKLMSGELDVSAIEL